MTAVALSHRTRSSSYPATSCAGATCRSAAAKQLPRATNAVCLMTSSCVNFLEGPNRSLMFSMRKRRLCGTPVLDTTARQSPPAPQPEQPPCPLHAHRGRLCTRQRNKAHMAAGTRDHSRRRLCTRQRNNQCQPRLRPARPATTPGIDQGSLIPSANRKHGSSRWRGRHREPRVNRG